MKFLKATLIICILGLIYSSCVKKANYPDVPVITFNSFTPYYDGSGPKIDSAILRVNFTDGNGDIGYPSQQEGVSPDFYVVPLMFFKRTQTYGSIPVNDSIIEFAYNVPYITPSGSDKELNGIIQFNFEGLFQEDINAFLTEIPPYDTMIDAHRLEFEIWMYDRAGNKSNVLITPVQYTLPE
jgi:hypothetical protein